ncbi:MAG TPA: IPT/TIG domain-containing protein, partial [Blastocatellia bacterium]|nr:IPT/TIG domain-containing protein [Blastocatellia bacterium]
MYTRNCGPAELFFVLLVIFLMAYQGRAQERLCDSAFEDCRTPIWNLIDNENTEIDIGFWFMQDTSYVSKVIARFNAGVKVRIIVDPRANATESGNQQILSQFAQAGIPMEYKLAGGIYHWKMMLFAGQNKLQFSGADYGPFFFVPAQPYSNYIDESPYFTDDPVVVNSFKTAFDQLWTDSQDYGPFANMTGTPTASYPTYQISSDLNFPPANNNPLNDYGARAVQQLNQENQKIDVDMYRITSTDFSTASINAVNRGVPVRFLGDVSEYRDPARLWDSYNIDLMHMGGVQIKFPNHQGINHQKSILLYGQAMTVYGSSNWTGPSENTQAEHNYFTTKSWFFQWFVNQFERKWNSSVEYAPFVPQPPDQPVNLGPANAATGQPLSVTLSWDGGNWAHQFDIYFGTSSTPPLIASNILTPNPGAGISQTFTVTGLAPSTTYHWMIVGKTMANIGATGPVWSFTTGTSNSSSQPSVASLSKTSGPVAGGTSMTITGTGFVSGATVSFGNVSATSATVSSSTSIAATTPAHAAGPVDVSVVNPDGGTATLPQSFQYNGSTTLPPPRANLIAPSSGPPAGGTSVVITGSNFSQSATVTIGGVAATGVTVTNGVEITATTPPGALGAANVVVTNPDNQASTLSSAFTYANTAPAPTVTSISPASGPTSGETAITITGSGFQFGATVAIGGAPATNMIVYNSTTITCYTPPGSSGAASVVVTNYDGQSGTLTGGFTYFQAPLSISSVSPNSGSTIGGTAITITGTGFASGAMVTVGSATASNVNVPNATTIFATTPAHPAGTADVTVKIGAQQTTLSGGFMYIQAPPPSISSISPNTGYTGGGNSVTISGSNFVPNATVTIGGPSATSVVVQSASAITVNTPPHVAGTVDVVVTNTDGQTGTLIGGFTYSTTAPPPETVLVVADFSTNSLDTTSWKFGGLFSGTTDAAVPAAVANQSLEIGPLDQNTSGSHYNGIASIHSYNFTGAYAYVILDDPAGSNTAGDAMLTIGTDANDYYRIYVESGNLICQRKAAGTKATLFTEAYSAASDVYLRIRNDASNNAVFEVAPNASGSPGAWTQLYSEPWNSAIPLTSLLFELKAGTFQSEANAPGVVAFG